MASATLLEGRSVAAERKTVRARAFARWAKTYREDVMLMSQAQFGNYLQQFIAYILDEPDILTTQTDMDKAEAKLKGKLTEMVRGFEIEARYSDSRMNEAWIRSFVLFCITGDVRSDYNIFDYLDTNDSGRLPSSSWIRKEIPMAIASKTNFDGDLKKRVEVLEQQVSELLGRQGMESPDTTISEMLSTYVRVQMEERGADRASVLRSLIDQMNEDGDDFVRIELELILDKVNDSSYLGQVRAILDRLVELGVFLKDDGSPYTLSELLSKPLGFELIKEGNQKPSRLR